ncbi:MAG: ATP-binding protein [Candidatus Marinimicrobia bacterium]|nr:ATP-binding protein [Candidatus Neomarinimicrobiota bacterium]
MLTIILEIVRAILMGLLLIFLYYRGKKARLSRQEGWSYLMWGFALLFFGSLIDITDEFPGLAHFVIIGPTPTEAILEKIVGYSFGSIFLFIGFLKWIPIILKSFEMEKSLKKSHDELEMRVEERTEALTQANIQLKAADRMQSLFLANMSHELRTPLNSIIGFTGMILMGMTGDITAEQKKQLTLVKNSGQHLLNLINDILDISKIEAGKIDIFPEEFYIKDVVQEVIEKVTSWTDRKGLEIVGDIPEKMMIFCDRQRVKQVLMNLVSNAIKFTDQGSVKIESTILPNSHIEIRVIDTGIGIKTEDIGKLFKFFQQLDMTSTKKDEGTGLGLFLSKRLVTMLKGDISVKSEYGRGSEFAFTLPVKYKETK